MTISRRAFLGAAGAATLLARGCSPPNAPPRRRKRSWPWSPPNGDIHSHAWHMAERFLAGYPDAGRVASAAIRSGQRLCRSNARERSQPRSRPRVRLQDLSDRGRGAARRRAEARRRWRAADRRARQLSRQRVRPEKISALRDVQTDRRRLSRKTAGRRPSSTTSTCRGNGSGPGRWSIGRAS